MPPKELSDDALLEWYCMFVPGCVSLAACVYMLSTYAMFKSVRTPAVNLVMLQTVAELLFCLSQNVAFYQPPPTDTPLCDFQGWLINLSLLSSIMFTASISGYMNMTLRRARRQIALSRKNLTILAVGVFGFSGLCAALPFITDQYVELGPRCWIAEDEEGRDRNAGVTYRFIIIVIIWFLNGFIFVCYYEVIKYLRETVDQRTKLGYDKQLQRTIGILMYYPIICFSVWIPHIAIRLSTAIRADPYVPPPVMNFAHVILTSQGIFFAIAFSQYRAVRQEWAQFLFSKDSILHGLVSLDNAVFDDSGSGPDSDKTPGLVKDVTSPISTKNFLSSGFDVTTIDDIYNPAFSDFENDLEMRKSEAPKQTSIRIF